LTAGGLRPASFVSRCAPPARRRIGVGHPPAGPCREGCALEPHFSPSCKAAPGLLVRDMNKKSYVFTPLKQRCVHVRLSHRRCRRLLAGERRDTKARRRFLRSPEVPCRCSLRACKLPSPRRLSIARGPWALAISAPHRRESAAHPTLSLPLYALREKIDSAAARILSAGRTHPLSGDASRSKRRTAGSLPTSDRVAQARGATRDG